VTDAAAGLYLDLLKRCLLGLLHEDPPIRFTWDESGDSTLVPFDREARLAGRDWPSQAHTMIGMRRLENIETLIADILERRTPGDLVEAGVWRGGATIFMRGVLKAHGVTDRTVWVADSFAKFPLRAEDGATARSFVSPGFAEVRAVLSGAESPSAQFAARSDLLWAGTSYDDVRERFARYGLLDDQVRFLRGYFRHTLPSAPIERLALLRLDGDLYDSTYDTLQALYPRLSPGGFVIVDDYWSVVECREAVHDYLEATQTVAQLQRIDTEAVFWQKQP
jgi:Macrocin-O-methyltransferase (TylF)